jgi:diadenosine tetraphosphate (Ap4A) HIT family hydrolase
MLVASTELFAARLSRCPITPGQIDLTHADGRGIEVFNLPLEGYIHLLLFARALALATYNETVLRVGFVSDKGRCSLIPMHGLSKVWSSTTSPTASFVPFYKGFLASHSGPEQYDSTLRPVLEALLPHSSPVKPDLSFDGVATDENLFAKLMRGELPQWRFWEDARHAAFLTPFPTAPGAATVVPRRHLSSDIFSLETDEYQQAIKAAYKVAQIQKQGLGIAHIGLFFEGYEIDYTHLKLYPIPMEECLQEGEATFSEVYQGFLTTQKGPKRTQEEVQAMFDRVKRQEGN